MRLYTYVKSFFCAAAPPAPAIPENMVGIDFKTIQKVTVHGNDCYPFNTPLYLSTGWANAAEDLYPACATSKTPYQGENTYNALLRIAKMVRMAKVDQPLLLLKTDLETIHKGGELFEKAIDMYRLAANRPKNIIAFPIINERKESICLLPAAARAKAHYLEQFHSEFKAFMNVIKQPAIAVKADVPYFDARMPRGGRINLRGHHFEG